MAGCTGSRISRVSSAPQGLRFSGINDTDFRVYLLGNPVSALHAPCVGPQPGSAGAAALVSPARSPSHAGGLVAESVEHCPLRPLGEHHCYSRAERGTPACGGGRSVPGVFLPRPSTWPEPALPTGHSAFTTPPLPLSFAFYFYFF